MEWFAATWQSWMVTLFWVCSLAIVFAALVWLMPCNRGMFWWTNLRAAALTDLCYWFVTPVLVRSSRTVLLAARHRPASSAVGRRASPILQDLPIWQQCSPSCSARTCMLYWIHRGFHTRLGVAISMPSIIRRRCSTGCRPRGNHFVNNLFTFILADIVVLLLGFSADALIDPGADQRHLVEHGPRQL